MRAWLVLPLVLATSLAHAAKPSSADLRLGLAPGMSRDFGRQLARRIAVMRQAPVGEQSVNPGRGLRAQVRGAFAIGGLMDITRDVAEDGSEALVGELASVADEHGATQFRSTHIVVPPLVHGPGGLNVTAGLAHVTSYPSANRSTTTETHKFEVSQVLGASPRRKRVRLNPHMEISSTSTRMSVDITESGHAQSTIDVADSPSANVAVTHQLARVIDLGEERRNVNLPDRAFIGPASRQR